MIRFFRACAAYVANLFAADCDADDAPQDKPPFYYGDTSMPQETNEQLAEEPATKRAKPRPTRIVIVTIEIESSITLAELRDAGRGALMPFGTVQQVQANVIEKPKKAKKKARRKK